MRRLKQRVKELEEIQEIRAESIKKLGERLYILENPPEFKCGDTVYINKDDSIKYIVISSTLCEYYRRYNLITLGKNTELMFDSIIQDINEYSITLMKE